MSIKKVALSFALAGILGATYAVAETDGILGATSMVAETDGAFVGVQLGYGGLKNSISFTMNNPVDSETMKISSKTSGAFRYGFVAGYKQFFIPEFGLRYYASFDFGTDYKDNEMKSEVADYLPQQSYKVSTMNFDANVDMLYNFISNEYLGFGAFLGIGLGYVHHTFKKAKIKREGVAGTVGFEDFKMGGFDLGINFGLKAQIAQNHGIEIYSRFGLLECKKDEVILQQAGATFEQNFKAKQPYQVGLRYTYSF